jgi:hypothetical protein
VATGETSRYDEWGDPRPDLALADLFGVEAVGVHHGSAAAAEPGLDTWTQHTYLRLRPELRAGVYGPRTGREPAAGAPRHPVLDGFEDADVLPFGGRLEVVRARATATVPLTFIPPFPMYPPETSWMRQPATSLPALVLNEVPGHGRVGYLAADLDRCFGRDRLPDHGRLLANLVRWAACGRIPLQVDGSGLVDCHVYQQPGRLILHVVNLSHPGAWRPPLHELVAIGPLRVRVKLPADVAGRSARLLVADATAALGVEDGWASVELPTVVDHEVVVLS